MIEWKKMPRGSYRATVNGIELDVWQVSGWRFNALDSQGFYLGFETGLPSLDDACEAAIKFAETHVSGEVQP